MGDKQKVVMRVPVGDEKARSRVLKSVVGAPGIISVALEGTEKNTLTVIGEGIDSVALTKTLRKKVGRAELVTVGPVEEKKGGKPDKGKENKPPTENIEPVPRSVIYTYEIIAPHNPGPCYIL